MLDLKFVTENFEEVLKKLEGRNGDFGEIKKIPELQEERRKRIVEVESLKQRRNEISKEIGVLKREKKDVSALLTEVEDIKKNIPELEANLKALDENIFNILATIPNLPADDVPVGLDETDNKVIRSWGEVPQFSFEVKDHVTLSEQLGLLDFERAAKVTGTRFVVSRGLAARLERSLIQFMMDTHSDHGYQEVIPPYIVNSQSMFGTGQFPKFKEDAFHLSGTDWYLNPTAEVPTINMHKDEIIPFDDLPLKYVAFTTAFRAEAGSAGRDTRGMLRQHQFNKVELIKLTKPEASEDEHLTMLEDSERILRCLQLPYRVVLLSSGDMGFAMKKTYDLEVWLPGQNKYREIGSISNAGDYQARRANIRFKRTKEAKTEYVHTLNGSGLAIGRTVIAIIENYQNEDGSITIPEVLRPYMRETVIK